MSEIAVTSFSFALVLTFCTSGHRRRLGVHGRLHVCECVQRLHTHDGCMCSSHNISFLSRRTATNDVWIGLNDLGFSGLFSWSDHHEVTFTYWAPGEPNNHLGFNEDCVELFHQVLMRYKAQEPNVLNTGA